MAKKKAIVLIAVTSLMATVSAAAIIGVASVNESSPLKATTSIQDGVITFNGEDTVTDGTTRTTVGYTSTGGVIICKSINNKSNVTSDYVIDPQEGTEVYFYEADGVTEYNFEDLQKISFYHNDDTDFGCFRLHPTYYDGQVPASSYYGIKQTNPRTLGYTSGAYNFNVARLFVEFTAGATGRVNKLEVIYNCNEKTQTGITVSTQPTKTNYIEGETFDPSGMVVIANYTGNIDVAVTTYTYPVTPLTADDTFVQISHNGFTANVAISVTENTLPGTYSLVEGTATFTATLNEDLTGSYRYYNSAYEYDSTFTFTWSVDGSTVTFNKVSGTVAESGGSYRYLFADSGDWENTNTGEFVNATLKLYLVSGNGAYRSSNAKVLAKQ